MTGPVRRWLGYAAGILAPMVISLTVTAYDAPAFVFEHLIVLLVVAIAYHFGLGPSIAAVAVAIVFDNVMLRAPIGQPTITGLRDIFDLGLFATVALTISSLVRRADRARREAQEAAARERVARESRDRLIAAVAHDLATPLAVLSTTVAAAKMLGTAADAEWPRLLGRLDTACRRATSLIRSLDDARTGESPELPLRTAVHDLRAVVAPIVEMMATLSERHRLCFAAPDGAVEVRVDVERMRRLVENLVGNAMKYSPHGGRIDVSLASDGAWGVLRVRDQGIGIAAAALPFIFEHSYRAPDAAGIPGLGLGLTIAAQVAARHGGTIEVESRQGEGTTVTVRIPLAAALPTHARLEAMRADA